MSNSNNLTPFMDACSSAGLELPALSPTIMLPGAFEVSVPTGQWRDLIQAAKIAAMRWCGFWAQERHGGLEAFSIQERNGTYLIFRCLLGQNELLPSIAPVFPAADRPERHAHDLLGIQFRDQPDNRRWTRHQGWTDSQYPLLTQFRGFKPVEDIKGDYDYPFIQALGAGVVEIPVGPIHAGIIEPGHFRFQAVGEIVLNLEQRLGYVHKGIEACAVGRDAVGLARLAGRVSGDTTVGHCWAACQAMERAAGMELPERAHWLRGVMAERERIANHLGDIGAICNDVGFSFAQYQLTRLKEVWVRENQVIFGHRLLMDGIVPGGTEQDLHQGQINRLQDSVTKLAAEVAGIVAMLEDSESLEDRLMGTGRLSPEAAAEAGAVGYVGRASGQDLDVRRDSPYPPYDRLTLEVPRYRAGDAAARARVRADEIRISALLIREMLGTMPSGPCRTEWIQPVHECEGLGCVEGWRGEILSYIRFDDHGRVARFYPRDPSWLTWPTLEQMIQNNIVPDFPVCNKSVNGSYSGHDL